MPASNRPRAVWTGAISFGLVNAPVRMYTAIAEKDLRFNQLHEADGGRIGYVKVCKVDNEPVPADEIVKGYEVSKGEYVRMTDEDFQAARGEQHRGITIHDFVPAEQIDPIYFERTYFLGPEEGPGEAIYALLVEAMQRSGLSAIATYVHHDRENLACLRVRDGVITLEKMFFDDEVRSVDGIVPSETKVDKKQLKMAEDLIGGLHVRLRARALPGHLPRAAARDRRAEAPGQDDEDARARRDPDRARSAGRADRLARRRPQGPGGHEEEGGWRRSRGRRQPPGSSGARRPSRTTPRPRAAPTGVALSSWSTWSSARGPLDHRRVTPAAVGDHQADRTAHAAAAASAPIPAADQLNPDRWDTTLTLGSTTARCSDRRGVGSVAGRPTWVIPAWPPPRTADGWSPTTLVESPAPAVCRSPPLRSGPRRHVVIWQRGRSWRPSFRGCATGSLSLISAGG